MANEYGYIIKPVKLDTPYGDYTYKAKVEFIIENPGLKSKRIYPGIEDEWGNPEWGMTADEAYNKAKNKAKAWTEKLTL